MAALPPNGPRPSSHLQEPAIVLVQPKAVRPVTAPVTNHKKNESIFSPTDFGMGALIKKCHVCALDIINSPFTTISNDPFSNKQDPICSPVCFQAYIKQSTVKIDPTPILNRKTSNPKRPCNIPPPPQKPIPPHDYSAKK